MEPDFEFWLEGLPPTTNKAYVPVGNHLQLSTAGRHYKQDVRTQLLALVDETMVLSPDHWYGLSLTYYFPALLTKGKSAKFPMLRIDTTNREKLLVDTICEVLGVDDAIFKVVRQEKEEGPERVHVQLVRLHAFVDTAT